MEATSQDRPSEDAARQDAALQLLHEFENLFVATFRCIMGTSNNAFPMSLILNEKNTLKAEKAGEA